MTTSASTSTPDDDIFESFWKQIGVPFGRESLSDADDADASDDNDGNMIVMQPADAGAEPVMVQRVSVHQVVRRRAQAVFVHDADDNDDPAAAPAAAAAADVDENYYMERILAAKLRQLRKDVAAAPAAVAAAPRRAISPPIDEAVTAATLLQHLVLVLDVGTHQTKLGVAVADARQAWEVSDAPFLRVCTALTCELFGDLHVGERLARIVFGELVTLPEGGAAGAERLREFQHVLFAFPGFYFHKTAQMRFARVFHELTLAWNRRFSAAELAAVLGVDAQRLTFFNSRTASGWAYIERFGCGERLGLVLTLGANAGLFGVWRGLMCFTRPAKPADRPASGSDAAVASMAFDAGSVHLLGGDTVRKALRFVPASPLAPEMLVACIKAAGDRLIEMCARTAAVLRVAPPTSVVVVLAGGGAASLPAETVRALELALPCLWQAQGIAAQVDIAPNALFNDLRGALYFSRLVAGRGSAGRLQELVDRPSALFVEQQLFRHDVATELIAYCANWAQTHPSQAAAMKTACKWLLARRRATLMTAVDSERAHVALDQLLRHAAFIAAFAGLEDAAAGERQCAFRVVQSERDLTLPDAMRHNMCGWIAAHWRELALALVGAAATDALELLTDVLLNTPPPPPATPGRGSIIAKLKHHVFAGGAPAAAHHDAPVRQGSLLTGMASARISVPPIAGLVFGGRRPKPGSQSKQIIELFGGVSKK